MLKELASLLCSLFVPKRAVNYWGGKLIYGCSAGSIGCIGAEEASLIPLPDPAGVEGLYNFVAPYDCIVVAIDSNSSVTQENRYLALSYNNMFLSVIRTNIFNLATSFRLAKGQSISVHYLGANVVLATLPVLPT